MTDPLKGTWRFRGANYPEAADEIFRRLCKSVARVGGTCTTDGQYFTIRGTMQAFKEAQEVLGDYGAEWELNLVQEKEKR